jgi:hypothetical protein
MAANFIDFVTARSFSAAAGAIVIFGRPDLTEKSPKYPGEADHMTNSGNRSEVISEDA